MISISAFEFRRGRWHSGQFLILIMRSKAWASGSEDDADEDEVAAVVVVVETCVTLLVLLLLLDGHGDGDGDEEATPDEDVPPLGVDVIGSTTLTKGLSLGSVTYCPCPCGCITSIGEESSPNTVALNGGPEKSSPSKKGRQPNSSLGVTDSDADAEAESMKLSNVLILFFSLAGRPSSVSKHWIVSSNVSSSSAGRLRWRVKKVSMVCAESVEPRESSIDVSSTWEMVEVSSVSYCLRYCAQNRWRSSA